MLIWRRRLSTVRNRHSCAYTPIRREIMNIFGSFAFPFCFLTIFPAVNSAVIDTIERIRVNKNDLLTRDVIRVNITRKHLYIVPDDFNLWCRRYVGGRDTSTEAKSAAASLLSKHNSVSSINLCIGPTRYSPF